MSHLLRVFFYMLSHVCVLCWRILQPSATTRKLTIQADRQNSEVPYYADDEDANKKKYTRRGK